MLAPQKHENYQVNWVKKLGKATSERSLEEMTAEILKLAQETGGLLKHLVSFGEIKESSAL